MRVAFLVLLVAFSAGAADLPSQMEAPWQGVFKYNFLLETEILYEAPRANLPTPDEIAARYPNPCGWNTGMEDGLLNGGPMLLAALARLDASGGADAEAERAARAVYRGLMRCATVSGVSGFLARSISPTDRRSIYPSSSRDQYTLFVYSMWRTWAHPFAARAGWCEEIRKTLSDVAAYCEKTVVASNDWSILRSDGGVPVVSKMWVDDPRSGKGLRPHEASRLPMMYAAAWSVTGDPHWRALYERYADDAIRMSQRPDAEAGLFAYLQMNAANRLLYEVDTNGMRRAAYGRLLTDATKRALEGGRSRIERLYAAAQPALYAPFGDWRKSPMTSYGEIGEGAARLKVLKPSFPPDREAAWWCVREMGERMVVQMLCPGWTISEQDRRDFSRDMSRIDFAQPSWTPPVHALWYYWAAGR